MERFTWEIAKGKDYNLKQVLAILTISGVEKIDDKSIFFNNLIYNVLSINIMVILLLSCLMIIKLLLLRLTNGPVFLRILVNLIGQP